MNDDLSAKLDHIISLLELLIEHEVAKAKPIGLTYVTYFGDGAIPAVKCES